MTMIKNRGKLNRRKITGPRCSPCGSPEGAIIAQDSQHFLTLCKIHRTQH